MEKLVQKFELFNNDREVKEFFMKISWDKTEHVYEVGIILNEEETESCCYEEFADDNNILRFKDIDSIVLDKEIWPDDEYPVVCYFNFTASHDRCGSVEMRLFDKCSLKNLNGIQS